MCDFDQARDLRRDMKITSEATERRPKRMPPGQWHTFETTNLSHLYTNIPLPQDSTHALRAMLVLQSAEVSLPSKRADRPYIGGSVAGSLNLQYSIIGG